MILTYKKYILLLSLFFGCFYEITRNMNHLRISVKLKLEITASFILLMSAIIQDSGVLEGQNSRTRRGKGEAYSAPRTPAVVRPWR